MFWLFQDFFQIIQRLNYVEKSWNNHNLRRNNSYSQQLWLHSGALLQSTGTNLSKIKKKTIRIGGRGGRIRVRSSPPFASKCTKTTQIFKKNLRHNPRLWLFGAAVLVRRRFGAEKFCRRDVLAQRRFGAETFWRRHLGAEFFFQPNRNRS